MKKLLKFLSKMLPFISLRISGRQFVLRLVVHKQSSTWSGDYRCWDEAERRSKGYDADDIVEKVKDALLHVKNGEAAYERDSVLFREIQYSWPVTAAILWSAAKRGGTVDVLDFGGSLGSSWYQNRPLLDSLPAVTWSIIEQPRFVECGKRFFQDDHLHFYPSIEECVSENPISIALLSSVLQYLADPWDIIKRLKTAGIPSIVIDLTPVSDSCPDRITVQNVSGDVYHASYPCRIFNEAGLLKSFMPDYHLLAKFPSYIGSDLLTADGKAMGYRGYILESSSPKAG